jgi:hypothetical protein
MDKKAMLRMVDENEIVRVEVGGIEMFLPFGAAYIITNDGMLSSFVYSQSHFDLFGSPEFAEIAKPYARRVIEATCPFYADKEKTFVPVYEAMFECHVDKQYALAKELLGPSGKERVLEVGCASGNLALRLAKDVGHITAVDVSEAFIERANQKKKEAGIEGVDFLAKKYPFEVKEDFDCMIMFGMPPEPGRIPASKAVIGALHIKNKEAEGMFKRMSLAAEKFDNFSRTEILKEEWPSFGNTMETTVLYMEKLIE